MARMRSFATEAAWFAPTLLTTAAMSRWVALGTTSTSLRSAARKSGRIRRRVILRPRLTSGGFGTTNTPMLDRPRGEHSQRERPRRRRSPTEAQPFDARRRQVIDDVNAATQ